MKAGWIGCVALALAVAGCSDDEVTASRDAGDVHAGGDVADAAVVPDGAAEDSGADAPAPEDTPTPEDTPAPEDAPGDAPGDAPSPDDVTGDAADGTDAASPDAADAPDVHEVVLVPGEIVFSFDDEAELDPALTTARWEPGVVLLDLEPSYGAGTQLYSPGAVDTLSSDGGPLAFSNILIPNTAKVSSTGALPLELRSLGDVHIGGMVDLSGKPGAPAGGAAPGSGGVAGPGGGAGGDGSPGGTTTASAGQGDGGGAGGAAHGSQIVAANGGGGGFALGGEAGVDVSPLAVGSGEGGPKVATPTLAELALADALPGGSGGGGGGAWDGGLLLGPDAPDGVPGPGDRVGAGGGGGGGALRIRSAGDIVLNGSLIANGGAGGAGALAAGGPCCKLGPGPGCDGDVEACACAAEPTCCTGTWTDACVDAAEACGACGGIGGAGGGGSGGLIALYAGGAVKLEKGRISVRGGKGGRTSSTNQLGHARGGDGSPGMVLIASFTDDISPALVDPWPAPASIPFEVPDYGSGEDGALEPTEDMTLDADAGPWTFTTVHIPAGVTVYGAGSQPLVIAAQQQIRIDGVLDARGQGGGAAESACCSNPGPGAPGIGGAPGPGGGRGGDGSATGAGEAGEGVVAGQGSAGPASVAGGGGGGGAVAAGQAGGCPSGGAAGAKAPPSGAAGATPSGSGGGGAGLSTFGGASPGSGGGGGGGRVVLRAPLIAGSGAILVDGGAGGDNASDGGSFGAGGGGGSGGTVNLVGGALEHGLRASARGGPPGTLVQKGGCVTPGDTPAQGEGGRGADGWLWMAIDDPWGVLLAAAEGILRGVWTPLLGDLAVTTWADTGADAPAWTGLALVADCPGGSAALEVEGADAGADGLPDETTSTGFVTDPAALEGRRFVRARVTLNKGFVLLDCAVESVTLSYLAEEPQ